MLEISLVLHGVGVHNFVSICFQCDGGGGGWSARVLPGCQTIICVLVSLLQTLAYWHKSMLNGAEV